jgi:hypothetical protein
MLNRQLLTALALICAALVIVSCNSYNGLLQTSDLPDLPGYQFEATGEDYLISALDEIQTITDWAENNRNTLPKSLAPVYLPDPKMTLAKTATDTVYIYGQLISGGYGAVVTERYAHPKGILLITVRRTYGKANGHIVTETRRYVSYADHRNDKPQQTNVTELYGTQTDTIVTHVLRDGRLETYLFRLPVVTKVTNPYNSSVRVTSRYAANGQVISRVVDGTGSFIQLRRSYGLADGSTVTRTEYPDGSWRQTRTRGEADKTITRETTSGLPTIGSGAAVTPKPPRPDEPMKPSQGSGKLGSFDNCVGKPRLLQLLLIDLVLRNALVPASIEGINLKTQHPFLEAAPEISLASGVGIHPKPLRPSLASGITTIPPVPRPPFPIRPPQRLDGPLWISCQNIGESSHCMLLASGTPIPPIPPRPKTVALHYSRTDNS